MQKANRVGVTFYEQEAIGLQINASTTIHYFLIGQEQIYVLLGKVKASINDSFHFLN